MGRFREVYILSPVLASMTVLRPLSVVSFLGQFLFSWSLIRFVAMQVGRGGDPLNVRGVLFGCLFVVF